MRIRGQLTPVARSKLDTLFVDISLRFIPRDFRVDFFKARDIARFRNQFARGQKPQGATFNWLYKVFGARGIGTIARELEYCKETSIFDDVTKNRGF